VPESEFAIRPTA